MSEDKDALYDEMAQLCADAPSFAPRNLTNPNNKWLVKSALQKAIRRGEIQTALRMGEYVYTADDTYCWQGIATMIVEDIGFGDPDLVSYSTQCTLKSVRDRMEPDMLYAGLIARACVADKSRACCEISLGCDIQRDGLDKDGNPKPEWPVPSTIPQLWRVAEDMSDSELLQMLSNNAVEAKYIGSVLLRKRLRGKGVEALSEALEVIMNAILGFSHQRACMLSFERTVDSMNLGMYPVTRLYQGTVDDTTRVEDDAFTPAPTIRTVPAYAFDMHTMQGNKASKMFHTELCKIDERFKLIPWDATKRPMGSLIFIVEGGQVSRRIRSDIMDDIKWFQDYNFMLGYGVPPEIATTETIEIVEKHMPLLNDFRKKVAS